MSSQTPVQWNYDNMDRLTDETLTVQAGGSNAPAAYDDQFQYDQNSNRTSQTITGGTTGNGNIAYAYNGDDQLTAETGTFTNAAGNYSTAYTYDADGNLQTQTRIGKAVSCPRPAVTPVMRI